MRVLLVLLLSSATILRPQAPPRERPTAGFVRKIVGEWELETGGRKERIVSGQALPVGAQVRLKNAGRAARIEIVRAHDVPFPTCRRESVQTLEICEATFTLPDTPNPLNFTARLRLIASRYFGPRESTYATPMVRGAVPMLEDGIAVLDDERIDLSRVLRRLARGSYRFRFTPLSDAASSRSETTTVASWTPDESFEVPAPAALKPGLYRISVAELRESAWVLLARRSDLQDLEPAMAELELVSAGWPLDAADKKGLRRALLEELSREVVRRPLP